MRAHLSFLFLFLACLGMAEWAGGAETWVEVRTPNFTVISNAGEGTAQKTILEFEQVHVAYGKVWSWAKLPPGRPVVVLALKNATTLKRWAPEYFETKGGIEVVSGRAGGADREYLLLRTDSRPRDAHVTPNYNLYRSYLGLLLSSASERQLPVWLFRGLSDVLANVSVREKDIQLGRPVPWQIRAYNEHARLPLTSLFDARRGSPLLQKEDQRRVFDAGCYVLVHYLLFGDKGAHSAKLGRFQRLWLAGGSPDEALAGAFGDLKWLERALPEYAQNPFFGFAQLQIEAKIAAARPPARVMPPAEVAGLEAAVHVAMGRPVEAQSAIREARTADPQSPGSYDAEGLLADRDRDKPRAIQAYVKAVELGSTSAHSHYRAAQLAWQSDADATALTALRRRLERAIELNDSYANALSFLAEVIAQQGDGQAALVPAERAVALEPGESYHRVALGRVLQKLGRLDAARQSAQQGLQLAESDADRLNAERLILYLEQSSRYEQERAQHERSQKLTNACQNGDRGACAEILPGLERACSQGESGACRYLGWLHGGGGGLARDGAKAAGYLEQACAAGDKSACVEHAWALARGEDLPKAEPRAIAALDALCGGDYLPACTRLGLIYAGKASSGSRTRARALFARACEGGEQDACSLAKQLR